MASLVALAVLLAAGAVAAVLVVRAQRPTFGEALLRDAITPPSAGAFSHGGVPLRDPLVEAALRDTLPDLVILLDRAIGGDVIEGVERERLLGLLTAPELMARFGPLAERRWRELLATYVELSELSPDDDAFDGAAMRLLDAAGLFDDQLAAIGLGYYIDADVFGTSARAHAILYSHRVEEVVLVQAGARPMRVLSLRRLDKLNVVQSLLGLHAAHLRDPLVLLDRIEEHVITRTLPALASDAPWPLGDEAWNTTPEANQVAVRAGEVARVEVGAAAGERAASVTRVAGLLAERNRVWHEWAKSLRANRIELIELDSLYVPEGALGRLAAHVSADDRAIMADLDERLRAAGGDGVLRTMIGIMASSVRRHEAQHGLDAARATPLPYPAALEALLGPELDARDHERSNAASGKAELSAYLSQIASDPVTPRVALTHLARFAFDEDLWGQVEAEVATVVLTVLATELGAAPEGPLVRRGGVDRERAARAYLAITARSPAEVQAAAARAWAGLFGEPLVILR